MANIYTSADQLIGKTPLLELTHIERSEGLEARIWQSWNTLTPPDLLRIVLRKP